MRWRPWLLGGIGLLASACATGGGTGGGEAAGCGPVIRERLDAGSALHLLPGAPEPDYLSEPPTSGPHLSGRPPSGALGESLDRPTQVLVLEQGGVLIQHRDVDSAGTARLAELAGDSVVVAPNPDLPDRVVATAWLAKLTCDRVELEALRQFVDEHLDQGPAGGEAAPSPTRSLSR